MSKEKIKAGLNLFAVLKNLEELVVYDKKAKDLAESKNVSIQFSVRNGPKAWVKFNNGKCDVGQGVLKGAKVKLWFPSEEKLNAMFDGTGNPIPLKGFKHLKFLTKEFTQITERLEYYLRPEKVENPTKEYRDINTRFTLTVATFAIPVIAKYDKESIITAKHIPDGTILMYIKPEGPYKHIFIKDHKMETFNGKVEKPDAVMIMKDFEIANKFLNGYTNTFVAIASGDVQIKGQTPMLDNISLILDKVQQYLD